MQALSYGSQNPLNDMLESNPNTSSGFSMIIRMFTKHLKKKLSRPIRTHSSEVKAVFGELFLIACSAAIDADKIRSKSNVIMTSV